MKGYMKTYTRFSIIFTIENFKARLRFVNLFVEGSRVCAIPAQNTFGTENWITDFTLLFTECNAADMHPQTGILFSLELYSIPRSFNSPWTQSKLPHEYKNVQISWFNKNPKNLYLLSTYEQMNFVLQICTVNSE